MHNKQQPVPFHCTPGLFRSSPGMTLQDRIEYLPRLRTLSITITSASDAGNSNDIPAHYKRRYTSNRSPDQIVLSDDGTHKILKWKNIDISVNEKAHGSQADCAKEIRCKCCFDILLSSDADISPLRVKYMPSEHWLELVECWSCHRDEFANVVGNTAEICAVPGCLLVGTDYYLLSERDFKQCNCMAFERIEGGIKLDKDDVLLDGRCASFESVLYDLLKSLIDAHGGWKYHFRAEEGNGDNNATSILLWVLAWDIWCAEGEGELRRAMRVRVCEHADDAFETRYESARKIQEDQTVY